MEGVPITNTLFPPPPGYYKAFTKENVERYADLTAGSMKGDASDSEELAKLRDELSPPRVDWVREDARWMLFGQMYTTEPHHPTARDIGLPDLVADPVSSGGDAERKALPTLLHSFLHTLVALVDALTNTARIPGELEMNGRASEGDQYIQHLSNLAATMMVSANQLRGVQTEATLVMLMEKQLEERRSQTAKLREKCTEVAATIRRLKDASAALVGHEGRDEIRVPDEGMEVDVAA